MRKEETIRKRLAKLKEQTERWNKKYPGFNHWGDEIATLEWVLCLKQARTMGSGGAND